MSTLTEKRCYYEVLGLPQSCTPDEIRSSYKKLALQRHPDKLIQSGVATSDATASFQELVHAYEVLSDPKERSWYDSHRSQILFSDINDNKNNNNNNNSSIPDLFSYFSASCYTDYNDPETGFYKVYGDVFNSVYANEVNYCRKLGLGLGLVKEAPVMGGLGSDYTQVTAFYGYWLGFNTVMDFGWVDKYDAMAGENRRSRRVMEEENKKVRKKAKREFNDTVRGLAEFVRKRDKRVIDMGIRKEKEREKKREEEMKRKKEREREKLERAMAYQEPEWARVDEEAVFGIEEEDEDEEEEEKRELYCAACGKKFKSDKQWKNHEQSRKHKEKVAELRRVFEEEDAELEGVEEIDDDDEEEEEEEEDLEVSDESNDGPIVDGFVSAEEDVESSQDGDDTLEVHSDEENCGDDLNEKFKECVGIEERNDEAKDKDEVFSDDKDGVGNEEEANAIEQPAAGSIEDVSVPEATTSSRRREKKLHVSFKDPLIEVMEEKKVIRKSRRAKKEKGKASDGSNDAGENSKAPSGSNVGSDEDDEDVSRDRRGRAKGGKKAAAKKNKRDEEDKSKTSSKGRKNKDADPVCEKCGLEFDSRNQLYKHLSDTGHASLKNR
ncbi:DNAJ protein JJJ1 homolog isoform X1 [Silene latifolia]|uniref:DNAJ protein JJJ1 homolog isoform X1 n=1 Tax=Silene latifolia TaxID=37657 RepID=UPI003D7803A6